MYGIILMFIIAVIIIWIKESKKYNKQMKKRKEELENLAKYVLSINPKLLVYTGDNIKNNEKIMVQMIKLDEKNKRYLGDKLKYLK
mgnify:FL=1